MTGQARHSYAAVSQHAASDYGLDDDDADWAIAVGDRITPPPPRSYGRAVLALIVIGAMAGVGWAGIRDPSLVARWWSSGVEMAGQASELIAKWSHQPAAPATMTAGAHQPASAVVKPFEPLPAAPSRVEPESPPAPPTRTEDARPAPVEVAAINPSASTLPATAEPPSAPSSDPLQARAEAVGLHPDLSRVLLAQLTEGDFRNADVAIRTALAETPDDGSHIWPKQRKAGLALFKVHFVAGAAPQCRRYVVTIAKDGWLTTALPMERCGVARKPAVDKVAAGTPTKPPAKSAPVTMPPPR